MTTPLKTLPRKKIPRSGRLFFLLTVVSVVIFISRQKSEVVGRIESSELKPAISEKKGDVLQETETPGQVLEVANTEASSTAEDSFQGGLVVEFPKSANVESSGDSFVKKIYSETWTDPESKPERSRVRIAETSFKYPRLRFEERVSNDPQTGEEQAVRVKVSVADHLLVGLKPGVDESDAIGEFEEAGYRVRGRSKGSFLMVEFGDFEKAKSQSEHIAELHAFSNLVEYAEPDWLVFPTAIPDDPAFQDDTMWGLHNPGIIAGTLTDADIDAPEAWSLGVDTSDVVVAVIDTGINYNHEDLAPNVWTGEDGYHGYDAYDFDNDPMDTDGHGTHCAGTIGASGNNGLGTAGVAWNVKLMALRFIGTYGGATSDAVELIKYARDNGADVINASWGGGGYSRSLENAIRACHADEIPFVAAAGNSNLNNNAVPHYPSSFQIPNIVSVAASDAYDRLAPFSNYGSHSVDIAAPGHNIWSCGIASDSDYRYLSGTSMAAPHVAGALAMAKAYFPGETCEDLITRLYVSVDKLPAMKNNLSSGGRLNLHKLLVASDPVPRHNRYGHAYLLRGYYDHWCGSNARMTKEEEAHLINHGIGSRSMWFYWTAPDDGLCHIKAEADIGSLFFEAFQRNPHRLIHSNNEARPTDKSGFYFHVTKGQQFSFYVDSDLDRPQQITVELRLTPVNDQISNATVIGTRKRIAETGKNTAATIEPFERANGHANRRAARSVWWKWTPNFSGPYVIATQGSEFDTLLAVYSGHKNSLQEEASNDDVSPLDWTSQLTLDVVSGTTYYIAVDSFDTYSTGKIALNGYSPDQLSVLKQPQGTRVKIGSQVSFNVVAAGTDLRYKWEFNGEPIHGAVRSTYTIQGVVPQDYGNYRVKIYNLSNTTYSNSVSLSEILTPPQIVWQTRSLNASTGEDVKLQVSVTGSEPMTYQWYKNELPIPGANGKILQLANVSTADEAIYRLTAANSLDSVPSAGMILSVYDSPWDGWQYIDPANQTGAVAKILHHNGQWVAASQAFPGIRISVSSDGKNWRHQIIKSESSVTSVSAGTLIYGNGMWLVGGQAQMGSTGGVFYKSTDLVNWQQINLGIALESHETVFHDGAFFLQNGYGGRVYRSTNGVTWLKQLQSNDVEIKATLGMASSPHGLLLCGNSTTSAFFLPKSSTNWQEIDIDPSRTEKASEVLWFKDRYVVYASGTYESTDGINWSTPLATNDQTYPGLPRNTDWFVEHGNHIYTSGYDSLDGGTTWSAQSVNPTNTSAAASDGTTVVFGTIKGGLFASDDPLETQYQKELFNHVLSVDYEGGQFLIHTIVKDVTTNVFGVAVSADSETWSVHPNRRINDTDEYFGNYYVKWINNEFWSPGHQGTYWDGRYNTEQYFKGPVPSAAWKVQSPSLDQQYLVDFAEGPAGIVAIRMSKSDSYGSLVKSSDGGQTWNDANSPGITINKHSKIQYIGGHYYCRSNWGAATSPDLITWTSLGEIDFLIQHDGKFWAWDGGHFKTSPNLVTWSDWTYGPSHLMADMASFGGAIVGIFDGRVNYTYDGINWVAANVGFMPNFLESSGDVLLVTGTGGQLARTGRVQTLAPVVNILEPTTKRTNTVSEGSVVPVRVDAFNPNQNGNPTVKLFYNDQLIGERSSPPYNFEMAVDQVGEHIIHVEARVGSGVTSYSHRHIRVTSHAITNRLTGSGQNLTLPGQTYFHRGVYFNGNSTEQLMSYDLKNWLPTPDMDLEGMVSGNNSLVVPTNSLHGGAGSTIAVSSNGISWQSTSMPDHSLTPIYFNNGYFWAMSASVIMSSQDGYTWQARAYKSPPSDRILYGLVAAGDPNGNLLAAPKDMGLWQSSDGGSNWTKILENLSPHGNPVYDGGRFLIWGAIDGAKHFGTSPDGINWLLTPTGLDFASLKYVGGVLYAFDTWGKLIGISQDGQNWQIPETSMVYSHITLGGDGVFYAAVGDIYKLTTLYRSLDGFNWQEHSDLPGSEVSRIFSTPDGLFSTSGAGHLWKMDSASNEWITLSEPNTSQVVFKRLQGSGNSIVALSSQLLHASQDGGNTWSEVYNPSGTALASIQFTDLFYHDGVWLAWAEDQALLRSTDGITFNDVTSPTSGTGFEALAAGPGGWLGIRDDGSVWSSTDGLVWTITGAAGTYPDAVVKMMKHLNGKWHALSDDDDVSSHTDTRLMTSADGLIWQQGSPYIHVTLGLESINGTTMIPDHSIAKYTTDGVNWKNTSANRSVFTGNGSFYILRDGWLESSTYGTAWTPIREQSIDYTAGTVIDGNIFLYGTNKIAKINSLDIKVEKVEMAAAEFAVGDVIDFSMSLKNEGTETLPAGDYPVEVFLSTDVFHGDADDNRLGTASVTLPELAPGSSTVTTVSAIIPNTVNPGNFHIRVIFNPDELSSERLIENNFAISRETLVSIEAWTLSVNTNGGGQISQDANNRTFANGRRVSLIATAGKGSAFEEWAGDAVGTASQITVLMNGNKSVQANFSSRASLQVEIQGSGQVTGLAGSGRYALASVASVTAVAADGWVFDGWSGAASGNQSTADVTMDQTKTLVARFVLPRTNWKSRHFNASEMDDAAVSADDADPDRDGLKNWQEYLHGSSPRDKKSNGRIRMKVEGGFLSLIYTRMAGPESGMSVTCRASRGLQSWDDSDVQERVLSVDEGVETVEARLPANGASSGFFRFEYWK